MKLSSNISKGKWTAFTKQQQLMNIASELTRISAGALRYGNNDSIVQSAYERVFDLIDLTIEDPKWRNQSRILFELRDAVAALYVGKADPAVANILSNFLMEISEKINFG